MRKIMSKITISMLIILMLYPIFLNETVSAYSPFDVENSVKNNWDNIYGFKNNNMRSGRNIVYDVYSEKYIDGGYRVVNQNFGNGSQPYIHFSGWAVNFGYKRHTTSNHD